MEYIIVIGVNTNESDSPLAKALRAIGAALGKEPRVFVATQTGTSEYPQKQKEESTVECVRRVLSPTTRLLHIDTVSNVGNYTPIAGLLVWLAQYRAFFGNTESQQRCHWISFENIIDTFFMKEGAGIFWSGLVRPKNYQVQTLARHRWKNLMAGLEHIEKDVRRAGK